MLVVLRNWESSSLTMVTIFGNIKITETCLKPRVPREPRTLSPGNLIAAIELCLATNMEQLEQNMELMEALGYRPFTAPSSV